LILIKNDIRGLELKKRGIRKEFKEFSLSTGEPKPGMTQSFMSTKSIKFVRNFFQIIV
jgi:hypothetical protein